MNRPSFVSGVVREPRAVKVPEVIAVFWLAKLLTTAAGEAGSDYLAHYGNFVGGGTVLVIFVVGLVVQFGTSVYRAAAYWFFAYAIAIFGTAVSDFLHLDVHLPYAATSILWAVVLAAIFVAWYRTEGTLSIHSIASTRRELFYWATVFATFALGTALGDYTAIALHLGYFGSIVLFAVLIVIPAIAHRWFGLNAIAAFWSAYVVTRPLGASVADYLSKSRRTSGAGFGDGPVFALFTAAVALVVIYLIVVKPDVQDPRERV